MPKKELACQCQYGLKLCPVHGVHRFSEIGKIASEAISDYQSTQLEVIRLRNLLWQGHKCTIMMNRTNLHGADGEMKCTFCEIDFRRDPIDLLENQMREKGMLKE